MSKVMYISHLYHKTNSKSGLKFNKEAVDKFRNQNLFRSLSGKEEEAVCVNDYRELNTPSINNKLLIFSEHTSNEIKYIKVDDEEASLLRSSEGFDMGA